MSNFNINNTLAELEDNLKKMDSARSQVSNLSQLVSQLTEAYTDTLGQLKKIESSIHYDEKYFEKKFGKSINELDTNINLLQSKVVDHNNSVNSIHEKASKDFINSLKKSEENVKLYIDDIKPTLEKVQTEFKNKNEEIIVDLKQKIKEVIETSSEKINEIKGLDVLKEINSIENTTKEINSNFENVFSSLDNIQNTQLLKFENILTENKELKNEIQNLKSELNSKFEKSDTNFKILLAAIVVTLIVVIAIKFV
ncbi:hypothetical protein ACTS91_10335 [Empedobacter falsenii]